MVEYVMLLVLVAVAGLASYYALGRATGDTASRVIPTAITKPSKAPDVLTAVGTDAEKRHTDEVVTHSEGVWGGGGE